MIGDAILVGSVVLAIITGLFAVRAWRMTRQRYFDDYIRRKRDDG